MWLKHGTPDNRRVNEKANHNSTNPDFCGSGGEGINDMPLTQKKTLAVKRILDAIEKGFKVKQLNSYDLANALMEAVWGELEFDSIGSALVEEAIERLKESAEKNDLLKEVKQ